MTITCLLGLLLPHWVCLRGRSKGFLLAPARVFSDSWHLGERLGVVTKTWAWRPVSGQLSISTFVPTKSLSQKKSGTQNPSPQTTPSGENEEAQTCWKRGQDLSCPKSGSVGKKQTGNILHGNDANVSGGGGGQRNKNKRRNGAQHEKKMKTPTTHTHKPKILI